jgi:predicted KAP-like P-loop ATPase
MITFKTLMAIVKGDITLEEVAAARTVQKKIQDTELTLFSTELREKKTAKDVAEVGESAVVLYANLVNEIIDRLTDENIEKIAQNVGGLVRKGIEVSKKIKEQHDILDAEFNPPVDEDKDLEAEA